MSKPTGVITFATVAEAAIFENEIKGQLSDGAWENSEPYDHYVNWCGLEVKVDPDHVGISPGFVATRNTYGLARQLTVVFDRMLSYARWAKYYGVWEDRYIDSLERCDDAKRHPEWVRMDDWNKGRLSEALDIVDAIKREGDTRSICDVADDESLCDEKELRRILASIQKVMKMAPVSRWEARNLSMRTGHGSAL